MKNCISKIFTMVVLLALSQVSVSAYAATAGVGKAIISIGKVTSKNKDGVEAKLKRRGKVFEGDTITVGNKSRLQLRFVDNQLVVLKANTVFRIDEYKFKGKKDNNKTAALSLLKGGMRSVTGLIGKSARDKYKVKTPVATMGVRGTHYVIQICSDNCGPGVQGIVGTVLQGAIVMSNDAGTQQFGTDQFFNVPSNDEAPKTITNPPRVLISRASTSSGDGEEGDDSSSTDDTTVPSFTVNEEGTITTSAGPLNTDPFYTGAPAPAGAVIAIAGNDGGVDGAGGGTGIEGTNALIDLASINGADNQPVSSIILDQFGTVEFQVKTGAVASEQGGDMLGVNWGRWASDDVVVKDNGSEISLLTGLPFIYSPNPTSFATLSGLNGMGAYTLTAGPTIQDENGAILSGFVDVLVDFGNNRVDDFTGSLSGGVMGDVRNYSFGAVSAATFSSLQAGGTIDLAGSCDGGVCSTMTPLTGDAGLQFIGPNAEAIIGYFGLNGTGVMSENIGVSGVGLFTPFMGM